MAPSFHHHTLGGETDSRASKRTRSAHQKSISRNCQRNSSSPPARRRHHHESPTSSKRRKKSPEQEKTLERSRYYSDSVSKKKSSKTRSKLRSSRSSERYSENDRRKQKTRDKKRPSSFGTVSVKKSSKSPSTAAPSSSYSFYGQGKFNRFRGHYTRNNHGNHLGKNQDMFIPDPPGSGAKGPPMPLHPPNSRAALRVLILVGLISSKIQSSEPYKFTINCPIHSMAVARILRNFFRFTRNVPSTVIKNFSSKLIAFELIALSKTVIDPVAGEVPPPLSVEILESEGECILETFDFLRSNFIVRTALSREHPSNARLMWDPNLSGLFHELLSSKTLRSGIGLGVEVCADASQIESLPDSNKPYPISSNYPSNTDPNPLRPFSESPFGLHQAPSNSQHVDNIASSSSSNNFRRLPPPPPPPLTGLHPHPPPPSSLGNKDPVFLQSNRNVSGTGSGMNYNAGTVVPSISSEDTLSLEKLLSAPSAKEQQAMETNAELLDLFAAPTAKHAITTRTFQNRGGSRVQQICPHGTRHDCLQASIANTFYQTKIPSVCNMVHFKRILLPHTDLSLGDCSYLDTCRHMSTCRFVHYEVDLATGSDEQRSELLERMDDTSAYSIGTVIATQIKEVPAQWITCDVRKFDFSIFKGKIKIVMADPPWDIHMDLPYGTMTDAEMKALRLNLVQDEGLLFLWVTGRAMELGRECMSLWGYKHIEEIVWVKTNQLHRIIRTGRTGHWLNHSKEHCLVGIKGNPKLNRHVDVDVIVAEVRETSRKPDEIYRIIERLSPGPYKLELFGRPHNVRNNWITLGNQLRDVYLHDDQLIQKYNEFAKENDLLPYEKK